MLVFDTGNMFYKSGTLPDAERALLEVKIPLVARSLGIMGYDGANVGWQDRFLPRDLLRKIESLASFPLLSANLLGDDGLPLFRPYMVKEFEDFRVGIFGLLSDVDPSGRSRGTEGFQVADPLESGRQAVRELQGRSCDLIVALTNLGIEGDKRLAAEVPAIDLILGGLDRRVLHRPLQQGGTLILQAGSKGMRLGRLELDFVPGSRGAWVPRSEASEEAGRVYSWTAVALSDRIPDHAGITKLLEEYRTDLKEQDVARRVSPTPTGAASPFAGAAACRGCHPEEGTEWDGSPHAGAFETLRQQRQDGNPACLECHVTAFGIRGGYLPQGRNPDLGAVQCEACHGPGRNHRGRGDISLAVAESTCRGCHNHENSPAFEYEKYMRKLGDHARGYFRRPAGRR